MNQKKKRLLNFKITIKWENNLNTGEKIFATHETDID